MLGVGGPITETSQEHGGQHTALSPPASHDVITVTDGKPSSSWRAVLPANRDQQQQLEAALEKVHLQVSQNGERLELKTVRGTIDVSDISNEEHSV
jgi:hypothetical protein